MAANILEDLQPPSKNFLATPLYSGSNIGKKPAKNTNSPAHVQMPTWVSFKKYRANDLEETCNHPNLQSKEVSS